MLVSFLPSFLFCFVLSVLCVSLISLYHSLSLCLSVRPSPGGSDGRCWILGTGRFGAKCFGPAANCKHLVFPSRLLSTWRDWFISLVFSGLPAIWNSLLCPAQPMMDRNCAEQLPKMQCGFIDFVCSFVYKVMDSSRSARLHHFS